MDDEGDVSEYYSEEDSEYAKEEDADEPTESLDTSDVPSLKENFKVESISSNIEEPIQVNKVTISKISDIKKRYTRRISLFEVTGIVAESYNLLQRGRLPLLMDLSNDTLDDNILNVVIKEIEEETCPIVIEKNGELLSVTDFDKKGLMMHLKYVTTIWKNQGRY
ncbi:m94r [Myxoma virus]|uniref:DNA-directed RNA polymerase 19 kDa subunit n=1 Tax=Myxoma virus TaxID=10273 RepID=A0A481NHH0_9POXV|nr:m94R [Myxoma virus]WGD01382.1 m94r [Myxoma virus]